MIGVERDSDWLKGRKDKACLQNNRVLLAQASGRGSGGLERMPTSRCLRSLDKRENARSIGRSHAMLLYLRDACGSLVCTAPLNA